MNATCLKIKIPTELTNGIRQPLQPHPRGIRLENINCPRLRNLSIDSELLICLFGKCLDLNYAFVDGRAGVMVMVLVTWQHREE